MDKIFTFRLFEKSLNLINVSEIINKKFIELQDQKGFLAPYAGQYSYEEHKKNIDIDDDDEVYQITQSKEFKDWLEYELEFRFDKLKQSFASLGNQIPLYREMTVKGDYLEKMKEGSVKRIGRYWTYDEDSAEAHWGHSQGHEAVIIFECIIRQEHIDWVETFRLNLEHESLNDEKEIRLFKNTKLNIDSIKWNGKEITSDELELINKYEYIS